MSAFEEAVANLKFLEEGIDEDVGNTDGKVALMTVHKSKGLEWPVVIAGLEEPKLHGPIPPYEHRKNQSKQLNYVGMNPSVVP